MKIIAFFLIAISPVLVWIESHNRTRMPSDQIIITTEEKTPPPDMMSSNNSIGIEGNSGGNITITNHTVPDWYHP